MQKGKREIEEINNCLISIKRGVDKTDELFELTSKSIFAVAFKYLRNYGNCEDILIEIFADMGQIASKYINGFNGYNYLCVIAKNRALDYIRSENRRSNREEIFGIEIIKKQLYENDELSSDKLQLVMAMEKLTATEYRLIYKTFWFQMTIRELAKEEKLSISTTYRMLQEAKKKLKKMMDI
ncbi:MAG: sigma-70 family RNA polymerase sigma factor [Clostridia bacterium]